MLHALLKSCPCAYAIARRLGRLSNFVYIAFVVGIILPFQLAIIPLYTAMSDLGLDLVDVKLEFINDGLQGYTVAVRRAQEAKLRAIAPQMLRAASSARAGAQRPGMASHTLDTCLPGFFCLTVTTY